MDIFPSAWGNTVYFLALHYEFCVAGGIIKLNEKLSMERDDEIPLWRVLQNIWIMFEAFCPLNCLCRCSTTPNYILGTMSVGLMTSFFAKDRVI